MRGTERRSASLEQDARQPYLAKEADVTEDKKTREHIEGAATAVQAKYGNRCSAKRIQAGPTSSTSFGTKAEPPALHRRDDISVDIGAAASKPRLAPFEMRTLTAADCLLPTGETSTATMIIFHQLPFWFCLTKEINEMYHYIPFHQVRCGML